MGLCVTATGALVAGSWHSAQAVQTHILKQGESLSLLARIYHVSVDDIVKANHLPNRDALHEGTKLTIPDPPRHVTVPATMNRPAKIQGDRIKVHIGPGTTQRLLDEFDMGAPLMVTAEKDGWFQVTLPDNRQGWVRKDFVKLTGAPHGNVAHIPTPRKDNKVPVQPHIIAALPNDLKRKRNGSQTSSHRAVGSKKHQEVQRPVKLTHSSKKHPSESNHPVAHTHHSSTHSVASAQHAHRRHHLATSAHSTHQERRGSASDTPTNSSDIVRTAYAYRGTPYHYGGTGRGGFDCSGFTSYLYRKQGVSLPHNAAAQYSRGVHISKSDLKPGDLVFFHCGRHGISHVGMYVGNGKFVHASSPHSGGVRVDSLDSGYYQRTYRGAARVKK